MAQSPNDLWSDCRLSRRSLLRLAALAAVAAGWPASRAIAEGDGFDARRIALQNSALVPGPAREKLLGIRLRHKPVPLTFPLDAIPGFSAAVHRMHFSHHYLEYLWRWESGERSMLRKAVALAEAHKRGNQSRDAFADARKAILDEAEAVRQSANMVLLHNQYWSGFSVGQSGRPEAASKGVATALVGSADADRLSWIAAFLPLKDYDASQLFRRDDADDAVPRRAEADAAGLHRVLSMDASLPFNYAIAGAIDCLDHAWMLDFPDLHAYVLRVLLNENEQDWTFWKQMSERAEPATRVGHDEDRMRDANRSAARSAGERPVADPSPAPEDHVLTDLRAISRDMPDDMPPGQVESALHGLRLAAGPEGYVATAVPLLYETLEVAVIAPDRPSGLAHSVLLHATPGLAHSRDGGVAP